MKYDLSSFEVGCLHYYPGFSYESNFLSDLLELNSDIESNPFLNLLKDKKLVLIGWFESELICVSLLIRIEIQT